MKRRNICDGRSNKVRHRGVIMKSAFLKEKFSQYLCFTVTIGSNDLIAEQENTEQQHQNYELIKPLYDLGMGYRKIAKYLNEQGTKTFLEILGRKLKSFQLPRNIVQDKNEVRMFD